MQKDWIDQFNLFHTEYTKDIELANLVKLANSVVGYQRIGQFGRLAYSTLQLQPN